MRKRRSPYLTYLVATALTLLTLLGSDRVVYGNPAESESLIEDAQEYAQADDNGDFDALANDGISIVLPVAASALHEIGCDVPLTTPSWRWRTRGPPSLAFSATV